MDLQLLFRVLWRFKLLVLAGFCVAVGLTVLSFASVSFAGGKPKLTPRGAQLWQSRSTLFITDKKFPWGRSVPQYLPPDPNKPVYAQPQIQVGDPNRFMSLVVLYAKLANSDPVRRLMLEKGPIRGAYQASPAQGIPYTSVSVLPLLTFVGTARTAADATETATRSALAFKEYLVREQNKAKIPAEQRVVVQELRRPTGARLISKQSKSVPMVVFMTLMTATVGMALLLENLRPRTRPRGAVEPVESPVPDLRRSA